MLTDGRAQDVAFRAIVNSFGDAFINDDLSTNSPVLVTRFRVPMTEVDH